MSDNLILAELDRDYAASDTTMMEKVNLDRKNKPLKRRRRHLFVLWLTALSLHALLWPSLFILASVAYMLIRGDVDASLLVPEILLLATVCTFYVRRPCITFNSSFEFKAEKGSLGCRIRLRRFPVYYDCASASTSAQWVVASRRACSEVDLLGSNASARHDVARGLRHLHHHHRGETAFLRDEGGCDIQ